MLIAGDTSWRCLFSLRWPLTQDTRILLLQQALLLTQDLHLLSIAVNWLDHSKTLREQGIDESETLVLRRKFFFSDQNVDARDPVQLNLLYVQVSHFSFLFFFCLFVSIHYLPGCKHQLFTSPKVVLSVTFVHREVGLRDRFLASFSVFLS